MSNRAAEHIHAGTPLPPLSSVYFYLTSGCNLACRHCWLAPTRARDGASAGGLSLERIRQVLDEAVPLGLTSVKLTGGEPLLHPQLSEVLSIVRDRDLTLTVETNGVLCTPQHAAAIAACRSAFVSVSLDAAEPEIHDRIRGTNGAFEGALAGIRLLRDAGATTQIIMSLMRDNVCQIEPLVQLAERLQVPTVKLNVIQPAGRARSDAARSELLSVPELIALARRVNTDMGNRDTVQVLFDLPSAFRPLSSIAHGPGGGVCSVRELIGVIADGHYALCGIGTHVPELSFGIVGQDRLADIWDHHPVLMEIREGMPDRLEGICSQCLMKHLCLGSCIAMNFLATGSLWAPYFVCGEAARLGLFPPSRRMHADPQTAPPLRETHACQGRA